MSAGLLPSPDSDFTVRASIQQGSDMEAHGADSESPVLALLSVARTISVSLDGAESGVYNTGAVERGMFCLCTKRQHAS